jgi:hypothetical protein
MDININFISGFYGVANRVFGKTNAYINEVELVITTLCTLKCKHCAHLIPYYNIVSYGGGLPSINLQPFTGKKESPMITVHSKKFTYSTVQAF